MTQVKIDHYLEVDFTSFMRTVDALGGVEICTATAAEGHATPAWTSPPARTRLSGGQALQYVRSRHVDGSSDLGRMQRQQRFLAALIDQATAVRRPAEPDEVPGRRPDRCSARYGPTRASARSEMLDARAGRCADFTPSSSEFTSVPLGRCGVRRCKGVGSTVKWDEAKAPKLFQALREDQPLAPRRAAGRRRRRAVVDVAPQQIRVQVENGTRTDGLGRRVDAALRATGFDTTRAPVQRGRAATCSARSSPTTRAGTARPARWRPRCRAASCGR